MVDLVALIIMIAGDFVCSIYVLVSHVRKHFLSFTVALATFNPQPWLLFGHPAHGKKNGLGSQPSLRPQAVTHSMSKPALS